MLRREQKYDAETGKFTLDGASPEQNETFNNALQLVMAAQGASNIINLMDSELD